MHIVRREHTWIQPQLRMQQRLGCDGITVHALHTRDDIKNAAVYARDEIGTQQQSTTTCTPLSPPQETLQPTRCRTQGISSNRWRRPVHSRLCSLDSGELAGQLSMSRQPDWPVTTLHQPSLSRWRLGPTGNDQFNHWSLEWKPICKLNT